MWGFLPVTAMIVFISALGFWTRHTIRREEREGKASQRREPSSR